LTINAAVGNMVNVVAAKMAASKSSMIPSPFALNALIRFRILNIKEGMCL
jgi:hypothetical protein